MHFENLCDTKLKSNGLIHLMKKISRHASTSVKLLLLMTGLYKGESGAEINIKCILWKKTNTRILDIIGKACAERACNC